MATYVLVHGAWADGSSWADVIMPLQSRGLKVLAAPLPLTSLSDDISALDRVLEDPARNTPEALLAEVPRIVAALDGRA